MPHKRSIRKQQGKFLRRKLFEQAFHDHRRAEKVNRVTRKKLQRLVQEKFGWVDVTLLDFLKGEVIWDKRGKGTLQTGPPPPDNSGRFY